jgi:hypothetical protein
MEEMTFRTETCRFISPHRLNWGQSSKPAQQESWNIDGHGDHVCHIILLDRLNSRLQRRVVLISAVKHSCKKWINGLNIMKLALHETITVQALVLPVRRMFDVYNCCMKNTTPFLLLNSSQGCRARTGQSGVACEYPTILPLQLANEAIDYINLIRPTRHS